MRDRLIELLKKEQEAHCKYTRGKIQEMLQGTLSECLKSGFEFSADYLLENDVIVSPLKMGDKVWIIDWCYEINSYEVTHIRYNKDLNGQRFSYDAIMVGKNGADIGFFDSDIGKYVFPTKEEAEQALKGGVQE